MVYELNSIPWFLKMRYSYHCWYANHCHRYAALISKMKYRAFFFPTWTISASRDSSEFLLDFMKVWRLCDRASLTQYYTQQLHATIIILLTL